jgi:hypothetical protein
LAKKPPKLDEFEAQLLAQKLALVRRYTGKRFSAAKGYDLRKGMSKGRMKTVEKYAGLIVELTDRPHRIYRPKRGEKREAFTFTGQEHHPRFEVAIIPVPDPAGSYRFELDRTRPPGSRFVMENRTTKERSWHIPAKLFLDENEQLYDEDADIAPEFFEYVLEQYAEQGPGYTYVVEAGEYHMWGASGNIPRVAEKLSELFKEYGAGHFDAFDKNSHFIGNWFRGVQVYTNPEEFAVYALARANRRADYLRERPGMDPFTRFRVLKSGDIGIFYRGKLINTISRSSIK